MTDGKPTPAATSSGPIAREIAEWLRAVRKGWTQSVDEPLSRGWRRFYAIAGSFVWTLGFALVLSDDPRVMNFTVARMTYDPSSLMLIFSAWFGYLVAYAERRSGPVRLFLDGLLLPAATVTIIGLSMGQIQSVREASRASSESQQDTLPDEPQESSESTQVTGGAEEPGGR